MANITANQFIVPVRDLDAASTYYCRAFELEEVFRSERIVFVGIPGGDSAIGLLLEPESAGQGPRHIGFHVDHALDRDEVLRGIEAAGGSVVERGEHGPGVPFARVADPDGNVIEI